MGREIFLGALIVLIFMLIYVIFYDGSRKSEHFNIPKDPTSEFIPANMSLNEYKTINQWDYPGYLNESASREFRPILVKPIKTET